MDQDKIQELLQARTNAEQELEKMRTPITILFSDIKGSTTYFEKRGDHEGLAMVQRHNDLLIPVIEKCGGRVVKTIGDAIMASFTDPVGAVTAAIGMQRALDADRQDREEGEQIHIRVGLHTGLGLVKENDIFGDVVNAASRVQHQAQPDQILITDVLIPAAKIAGVQCAKLGRAEMRGKDEPIDLYAVAWSASATEQLVEELQDLYDRKLKEAKRRQEETEEEFELARDQWRGERRRMTAEIEELEEAMDQARLGAKQQLSEELQSEIRFQFEEASNARHAIEEQFAAAQARWENERESLKATIASMQGAVIEAMERSNNPARLALAVREQVDARMKEAKQDWALEGEADRRRMTAEIERLKKVGGVDERKDTARRALLQKLGKLPVGAPGSRLRTTEQVEQEFQEAKIQWNAERDQFKVKLERMERDLQAGKDEIRNAAFQEVRAQYEPKVAESAREIQRLNQEFQFIRAQFSDERQQAAGRINQLELSIPAAQEAARRQSAAELRAEFDAKVQELNRLRSRGERRFQDDAEEAEAERRRLRKQVSQLEEQLREAKEAAYKATRLGNQSIKSE